MRRHVLLIVALFLSTAASWADDDPRAVIEKAIKARGGDDQDKEKEKDRVATVYKYQGEYKHTVGGTDTIYVVTSELFRQVDGKSRTNYWLRRPETEFEMITITDGKQMWRKPYSGQWGKLEEKHGVALVHRERAVGLSALLKDKGFTLSNVEGVTIDNRPTVGVKAAFKDQPDVTLYFDRQTGLLARYIIRVGEHGQDQDWAITLSDYRDLNFAELAEAALKKAGLPIDQAAVMDYLKRKAPDPDKLARAEKLVRQLGDDDFDRRETAAAELVKLGPVIAPLLRNAARGEDIEVVRRAEDCLKKLEGQYNPECAAAAVQLLGLRQPKGAVELLLAILPTADDPLDREILSALHQIAQRKGGPDEALVKALQDSNAVRRKAAEAVLGKDGGAYVKQPGRRVFTSSAKQPRKLVYTMGDSIHITINVADIQFFNRLDDRLFVPPEIPDKP